jgi:redox-sensitive bicupin YhaK (pirin superfamily)
MLYVISGGIVLTTYGIVGKECLVVFENKSEIIEISSQADAQVLLLAGRPIGEKVVQQGPFVMNNTTEILEAMRDYQIGKMGILIEEI